MQISQFRFIHIIFINMPKDKSKGKKLKEVKMDE